MIDRIIAAIEDLSQFPRKGHRIEERGLRRMEVRQWLVHPYRVVYRIREQRVIVLAIIHGARKLGAILKKRPKGEWRR